MTSDDEHILTPERALISLSLMVERLRRMEVICEKGLPKMLLRGEADILENRLAILRTALSSPQSEGK